MSRHFGADCAVAFGLTPRPEEVGLRVDFCHGTGFSAERQVALRALLDDAYAADPRAQVVFDARRPDPTQRNVLLDADDLFSRARVQRVPEVPSRALRMADVRAQDQLRTLLCDDELLLAFVALYRQEPFSPAERAQLQHLLDHLRARLVVRDRLAPRDVVDACLAAALDAMWAPAFVTAAGARVVLANKAGQARLAEDRTATLGLLADLERGVRIPGVSRTPIMVGGGGHALVVIPDRERQLEGQAAAAARRWRLTPRQAEVLGLVARGLANRSIALLLGCSEKTVVAHVTAILDKAGLDGRAALVSALITQSRC